MPVIVVAIRRQSAAFSRYVLTSCIPASGLSRAARLTLRWNLGFLRHNVVTARNRLVLPALPLVPGSCCGMSKVEEFRQYAEDCVALAQAATDPVHRARLIQMAAAWRDLANRLAEQEKPE